MLKKVICFGELVWNIIPTQIVDYYSPMNAAIQLQGLWWIWLPISKGHILKLALFIMAVLFINKSTCQEKFIIGSKSIGTEIFIPVDLVSTLGSETAENPLDIEFGADFTSPENKILKVPGFYNENGEYIIRFSPNLKGKWKYKTFSSILQLAGISGNLLVGEKTNADNHGAIIIDKSNPQKFVYEDGTPYFALAFELDWLFALDYDNKSSIPKTEKIVEQIKANGFNQVVMNVYAYNVKWKVADDVPKEYNFKNPDYSPFAGNNQNPDFSILNIGFFKHFDRVIHHLNKKGIVAHIMIYVWNKNVNWPLMYSANDNQFFDYVIKRYQAYGNIIWDVSKEALDYGRCDIPYINERIERIKKIDAYKRLITVHDYEYCSREAEKVDFISIQNWRSDLYSLSLEAYMKHADKPVMNIEHGGYEEGPYLSFEGNFINPETCLIRNYECVFAGLYSTYYWQNSAWDIVIYNPMDSIQTFKKPRFDYYKHLGGLFTRYNFNSLFPSKPKLTTNGRFGNDNMASGAYPLTNGKDLYLYLVPASNYQINLVLPEPAGGEMNITWFNPFTGEYKDTGCFKWSNWAGFRSPWKNTYAVLIVKLK